LEHFAGETVDFLDGFDLVERHLEPDHRIACGREDFDRIAQCVVHALLEIEPGTAVLDVSESAQKLVAFDLLSAFDFDRECFVIFDVTETVDARDRRDDEHITACEQVERRGVAELFDFLVDRRVFFDVRIGRRQIRLGLVVVVVGNEIRNGVLREKTLELAAQLRSQSFVVSEHEGWALHFVNDVRHRERFAGTRRTEERLVLFSGAEARDKLFDRTRLIACRLEWRREFELPGGI
jgi:hypothetical protein